MIVRITLALALLLLPLVVPALASETVKIRFGDHKGHSRAVFDFTKKTSYRIDEGNGQVRIHFDHPVTFDLSAHVRMKPRAISAISVENDGRTVVMKAASGRVHQDFRLGDKIVIDVAMAGSSVEARRTTKPAVMKADNTTGSKKAGTSSAAKASKIQPKPSFKPAPKARTTTVAAKPGEIPVRIEKRPGRTIVRFMWTKETALGVLHRGGHIWLGFATKADLQPADTAALRDGPLESVLVEPSANGTLVRLDVSVGAALDVTREGAEWVIDIGGARGRAEQAINFESQAQSAAGPRVFAALQGIGEPMMIDDPLIGDRIVLVPLSQPGLGVRPARQLVQMDLPETPQGVAIRFKSLELRVEASDRGLSVLSGRTLNLAAEAARRPKPVNHPPTVSEAESLDSPGRTILNMDDWRGNGPLDETRHKLLRRIVEAKPAARNGERRALAGFLVAHGLGVEALGVMARIEAEDRRVEFDAVYRAQRGIANLQADRYAEAAADLNHRSLMEMSDIALYRGLLASRRREFFDARREFTKGWRSLTKLPEEKREQFRLALAETALHLNDVVVAEEQLEKLLEASADTGSKQAALLLSAMISAKTGEIEDAEDLFSELTGSARRDIRAKARFAQTNLLLDEERITPKEAVEKLERLRFAWRGDVFEFDLLKRLGELYIETGSYRDGLVMMRRTIDQFPDLPEAQNLAGRMNHVFANLYEGQHAEAMSPVTAMSLYYDFRELTPEGARGDKMIQRLADRLAAVELLDEAAKLLEHQVRHRAKGEDKTRVGTRLAVLYLLDDKPREAIDALRASRNLSLAPELVRERSMLEARGLTELGKYDRALSMLNGMQGADVNDVRTEILWRARKWQRAAESLSEQLVKLRGTNGPLAAEARVDVLRYAIASSLAGDNAALRRLRGDFAGRMEGHPEWPAFQIVTAEDQRDSAEFRNLAAEIAQVDRFESFMASYRDRLRQAPLSAIN